MAHIHAPGSSPVLERLCGAVAGDITDDPRSVTCGDCDDLLSAAAGHPSYLQRSLVGAGVVFS